jgi:hypothetical protein
MPLPTPNTNESQEDFTTRCMADETMNSDFPDNSQRYAICISQFENNKLKQAIQEFKTKLNEKK